MSTMCTTASGESTSSSGVITLGIAGGSGGGKTTLARALFKELGGDRFVCYMVHDDYYKDLSHKTPQERAQTNFDHPESLDTDLMISHIQKLKNGTAIQGPCYCFVSHTRKSEVRRVTPKRIIIVEGILILTNPSLRKELDIMVYVDADSDVRLTRRMERDIAERGRTMDEIIKQYHATVRPMHEEWVEPSKRFADLIVQTNDHSLDVAVKMLSNHLRVEARISDQAVDAMNQL